MSSLVNSITREEVDFHRVAGEVEHSSFRRLNLEHSETHLSVSGNEYTLRNFSGIIPAGRNVVLYILPNNPTDPAALEIVNERGKLVYSAVFNPKYDLK